VPAGSGVTGDPSAVFIHSTDGLHWATIESPDPDGDLAFLNSVALVGGTLFASYAAYSGGDDFDYPVYASGDGGITWAPVVDGRGHPIEGMTFQVIGSRIVVFAGETGHVDGGVAWIGTAG
jgi:hypothetical protein